MILRDIKGLDCIVLAKSAFGNNDFIKHADMPKISITTYAKKRYNLLCGFKY